jgi:hypothetical protein
MVDRDIRELRQVCSSARSEISFDFVGIDVALGAGELGENCGVVSHAGADVNDGFAGLYGERGETYGVEDGLAVIDAPVWRDSYDDVLI